MTLSFTCACGETSLDLLGCDATDGTHTICYCRDCRSFARHLGVADKLGPGGALGVFITQPNKITVTRGQENLTCLRLSPKGLDRWYAACCNTPISSHVPGLAQMAGITAMNAHDPKALGPVRAEYCTSHALQAEGDVALPGRDRGIKRLMLRVLRGAIVSNLTGRSGRSPFRADGGPPPSRQILSKEERDRLRD